ncbi:MAG: hypothetical protein ACK4MT_08155, partial [Thermaurantiacus tibetensis]
ALARALGLTGTPSYIVGDRIIAGAVGIEELRKAIAEARRRPPAAADPAIAAPAGTGVASGKPAA